MRKSPRNLRKEEKIWKIENIIKLEDQILKFKTFKGFAGGAVVKNLPANAGDMGSRPGLGRSHMPWSG